MSGQEVNHIQSPLGSKCSLLRILRPDSFEWHIDECHQEHVKQEPIHAECRHRTHPKERNQKKADNIPLHQPVPNPVDSASPKNSLIFCSITMSLSLRFSTHASY